jgi:hypothetical protein
MWQGNSHAIMIRHQLLKVFPPACQPPPTQPYFQVYQYSFSCKGVSECLAYPDFHPNYNKKRTHTSIIAAIPNGLSVSWGTMGKLAVFLVGKTSSKVVKCVKAEKVVTKFCRLKKTVHTRNTSFTVLFKVIQLMIKPYVSLIHLLKL